MTTPEFNAWAARYLAALEQSRIELRAAAILNHQRTGCATTCRIEVLEKGADA